MNIETIATRHFEGKNYYLLNSYPTKFMARYFGLLYKADSPCRSYRVTGDNDKFCLWVCPDTSKGVN
jgi:hypothetical protein